MTDDEAADQRRTPSAANDPPAASPAPGWESHTPDHAQQNDDRPGLAEEAFKTGRHYALDLVRQFPGQDWIALVLDTCRRRRDEVEWHLQEDMVPPDDISQACDAVLARASDVGKPSPIGGPDRP